MTDRHSTPAEGDGAITPADSHDLDDLNLDTEAVPADITSPGVKRNRLDDLITKGAAAVNAIRGKHDELFGIVHAILVEMVRDEAAFTALYNKAAARRGRTPNTDAGKVLRLLEWRGEIEMSGNIKTFVSHAIQKAHDKWLAENGVDDATPAGEVPDAEPEKVAANAKQEASEQKKASRKRKASAKKAEASAPTVKGEVDGGDADDAPADTPEAKREAAVVASNNYADNAPADTLETKREAAVEALKNSAEALNDYAEALEAVGDPLAQRARRAAASLPDVP